MLRLEYAMGEECCDASSVIPAAILFVLNKRLALLFEVENTPE